MYKYRQSRSWTRHAILNLSTRDKYTVTRIQIHAYMTRYNHHRPHKSLADATPGEIYSKKVPLAAYNAPAIPDTQTIRNHFGSVTKRNSNHRVAVWGDGSRKIKVEVNTDVIRPNRAALWPVKTML